jgi:hypothetical protein
MTATPDLSGANGLRTLGRTGAPVEVVSLGGEGILRTVGRAAEAVPIDTVIIGCSSIEEVRTNLEAGRRTTPMTPVERSELEKRIAPRAARYDTFKA